MRYATLVLLLLSGPALGAEVSVPAEVKIAKGDLGDIVIKAADGLKVRWKIVPPYTGVFREYDPDSPATVKLKFLGRDEGTFYLIAWTAKGDTPSEGAVCKIVVGKGTPPAPPKPPEPKPPAPPPPKPPDPKPPAPPAPVDELAKKLQAAYTADPALAAVKESQRSLLAALYEAMQAHAVKKTPAGAYAITTTEELLADLRESGKSLLIPSALIECRKAIAAEVALQLGTGALPLTDELRARAVTTFKRVETAIEACR